MASTSTQIASSSSSSTLRWRYDAFLSFYGEDTRKSFTDHLYAGLKQKGILVFRDDEKLVRGKYVSDELLKAIQESMYAIVVISQNYASSRWCLIELAKIVECMRDTGLTVLPIFYHVDPSHVRNQTGSFAEAFASHKKDPKVDIEMMQKWRAALSQVGSISGWHVHDRHESIVVEEISRMIFSGRSRCFSNVLFGIESRVEEMMRLLCIGLDDVRFIGICGIGGIGKTTLSKAIYERVSHQFEASCFIDGIREESRSTRGLVDLKIELISLILGERDINIRNDHRLSQVIANRLRTKKVFIVLDDVDGKKQLEALAGSHGWFGEGSRIIITSRDRHLLNRYVDDIYEVMVLNDAKALRLFSWKAFKKPHPEEKYVQLSKDVMNYAGGLPLALEVFGSFLYGREMDFWIGARNLLKEKPNAKILDILKISFDGLEEYSQKQLFLDIACFFGEVCSDNMRDILDSLGHCPDVNINVLVDKSLLTISSWGSLRMHDLLRKMGQQIVDCEFAEEPGRRSRLWRNEDVLHVLKNNTGTDAVKGIVLKLSSEKQERLNVEAFSKMKKLKILYITSTPNCIRDLYYFGDNTRMCTTLEWHGDPSNFMLSNELCFMKMPEYPFESLPINFQPDNLVELIMPHSCIKKLWDGRMSFPKLKRIDLSFSKNLVETPDLSGVPNLKKLKLECCTSLSKVHPSTGFLRRLRELDLQDCKSLERLVDEMRSESLESLVLSGCSRLNKLPDFMDNLVELIMRGSCIQKLWDGKKNFPKLKCIYLSFSKNLVEIPDLSGVSNLEKLELECCTSLSKVHPSIGFLRQLKRLDLQDCKSLERLADEMRSESLEKLVLSGCSRLNKLPDFVGNMTSLWYLHLDGTAIKELSFSSKTLCSLNISNCSRLEKIPKGLISVMERPREIRVAGSGSDLISILMPNSFSSLSSLRKLDFSNCNLSDGAIPNDLCCLSSLEHLNLSRNKFTRIPDIWQLSKLESLNLSHCCNLLDVAIPNDLSGLSSLQRLSLSGNNFTRLPDTLAQLSRLERLQLEDCSRLQVLLKLPFRLKFLWIKGCPLLKMFYDQLDVWTSNEILRSTDCSFGATYIDYDGKPSKILYLHPRSPLWIESDHNIQIFETEVACGPALLGSGIPEWFNDKSTNSSGTIQMHTDLGSYDGWTGYALFIVYEFHEPDRNRKKQKVDEHGNSNSRIFDGGDPNFPSFLCQFQVNEVDIGKPLVLFDYRVPSVEPSGFWAYIPATWFRRRATNALDGEWSNLKASITTGSLNVEVKECGARVVREHDASEFYQFLNSISPSGLESGGKSFLDLACRSLIIVGDYALDLSKKKEPSSSLALALSLSLSLRI